MHTLAGPPVATRSHAALPPPTASSRYSGRGLFHISCPQPGAALPRAPHVQGRYSLRLDPLAVSYLVTYPSKLPSLSRYGQIFDGGPRARRGGGRGGASAAGVGG